MPETGRVSRGGLRTSDDALAAPAAPVPTAELLAWVLEIRRLLEELRGLSDRADSWGMRVLWRNVALAIGRPETLADADNQMDFIEELAEALWDGADTGFRHAGRPAATWEQTLDRERRRSAVVHSLDEVAYRLCRQVESWRRRQERPPWTGPSSGLPQGRHRL
jgi:hypothetical protein